MRMLMNYNLEILTENVTLDCGHLFSTNINQRLILPYHYVNPSCTMPLGRTFYLTIMEGIIVNFNLLHTSNKYFYTLK